MNKYAYLSFRQFCFTILCLGCGAMAWAAPGPVTGLKASKNPAYVGDRITISWNKPSDFPGTVYYNVFAYKPGETVGVRIASGGTGTSVSRSINKVGTHRFEVKACDGVTGCSGAVSLSVTATNPPSPPSITSFFGQNNSIRTSNVIVGERIYLKWAAHSPSNTTLRYTLTVKKPGESVYSTVPMGSSATSFNRWIYAAGTHRFRITACDSIGCGSSDLNVTATALPDVTLGSTKSSVSKKETVELQWSIPSDFSLPVTYNLEIRKPGESAYVSALSLADSESHSYTLAIDGTHSFRVQACNNKGTCGNFTEHQIVASFGPPTVQFDNTVSNMFVDDRILLQWSAESSTGATINYDLDVEKPGESVFSDIYIEPSATTFNRLVSKAGMHKFRIKACDVIGCSEAFFNVTAYEIPALTLTSAKNHLTQSERVRLQWATPDNFPLTVSYNYDVKKPTDIDYLRLHEEQDLLFHDRLIGIPGTHQFRVQACKDVKDCGPYTYHQITADFAPPVPSLEADVTSVNIGNKVNLSWGVADTVESPLTYNLEVKKPSDIDFYVRLRGTTDEIFQRYVGAAGKHTFRVNACFPQGQCSEYNEIEVNATSSGAACGYANAPNWKEAETEVGINNALVWNTDMYEQCTQVDRPDIVFTSIPTESCDNAVYEVRLASFQQGGKTESVTWECTERDANVVKQFQASIAVKSQSNLVGTNGDDVLTGTNQADVLDGKDGHDTINGNQGDDVIEGGKGNDKYYYQLGDGSDVITDSSGTDQLIFGEGITVDNIDMWAQGVDGDLLIKMPDGAVITIKSWFLGGYNGPRVENFVFAGGSVLNRNNLYTKMELRGGEGNDTWRVPGGTYMHLSHRGGKGNDAIYGGSYNDYYYYRAGDGNDVIEDGRNNNRLFFEELNSTDINVFRMGQNIIYLIKHSGETVVVKNWFASTSHRMYETSYADKVERYGTVVGRATQLAGDQLAFLSQGSEIDTVYIGQQFEVLWSVPEAVSCVVPDESGKVYQGTDSMSYTAYTVGAVEVSLRCSLSDGSTIPVTSFIHVNKLPAPQELKKQDPE